MLLRMFVTLGLSALAVFAGGEPAVAQITGPTPPRRFEQPFSFPFSDPRRTIEPEDEVEPPRRPAPRARPPKAEAEAPRPVLTPAQQLDQLYARLAAAKDAATAQGVTRRIERMLARSSSPTGDLLMARAAAAALHDEPVLAEDLLDRIIEAQPGWAQAWATRAALRAKRDDISGAIADYGRALAAEPRHIDAMTGLGFLLLRIERKDEGVRVLKRALTLNPFLEPAKHVVDKLAAERAGQEL
jgi:tetratricopeptide (TPR) repeat protein